MRPVLGYLLFFSVLSIFATTSPEKPQPLAVNAVSVPVTINGFLNEWGDFKRTYERVYLEDPYITRAASDRNKVWCRLLWDRHYLYIAFKVEDSRLLARTLNNDDYILNDDGIELFIDKKDDTSATWSPDVYHILLGLNNNLMQKQGIVPVPGNGKIQQTVIHNIDIKSFVRVSGTVNNNNDIDSGYQAEIAIAWKSLGVNSCNGFSFRFNFAINEWDSLYIDTTGSDKFTVYYHYAGNWVEPHANVPANWQSFILEGGATVSKDDSGSSKASFGKLLIPALFLLALIIISSIYFFVLRRRSQAISSKLRSEIEFKLKSYIDENFRKKVLLEDFCNQYNLGLRQVQRWLKNDLNTTFNEMLTKKKMSEAKQQLEMTDKTVSEICFDLGYNDTSYFTKVFRGAYGIAPTDIRKAARKG
ncbi:MAG: helix-turn-helix domain-containing protein [Fibrobacteres bacterium]|nr:helix-turn-helix domain-containing protein [Fibrobacterota bacterium]